MTTPNRHNRLTGKFVKDCSTQGRYGDGRGGFGLSLLVKQGKNGVVKSWSQRLYLHGKPRMIGLGAYPQISLQEARDLAAQNAVALKQATSSKPTGIQAILADAGILYTPTPAATRLIVQGGSSMPTFAQVAEDTIAAHRPGWKSGTKTERMWRQMLTTYAYPEIGDMPIDTITSSHIIDILMPIWHSKAETARKTKQRISAVMSFGIGKNYRTDNPVDNVDASLPRGKKASKHNDSMPYPKVPAFIERHGASGAAKHTKLGFRFLILTGARTQEARFAEWKEIDLDNATWTIPAERMKAGRQHRVALSKQAMDILKEASALRVGGQDYIFANKKGKPVSEATYLRFMVKRNIYGTPHGMRSSFRDWAAEMTDYPREMVEAAIAHLDGSDTERAYRRTDYLERRRELMQEWADYLRG